MFACVLIPRELSLVISLHPLNVMEMSATVWSNTHLSPGLVLYPDEGEVRMDRLNTRAMIRDDDIRRGFGCYDTILIVNGQEVRHCNWVRFVKITNDPNVANIISSKVKGHPFFQVIRPIKPNEEIFVLFHVPQERPVHQWRAAQSHYPFLYPGMTSYPASLHDLHMSMLLRHNTVDNANVLTSTPVSTMMPKNEKLYLQENKRSVNISSSSSSSFTSPSVETPHSTYKMGVPIESSCSSPMLTSTSGSSRETTASEEHLSTAERVERKDNLEETQNEADNKTVKEEKLKSTRKQEYCEGAQELVANYVYDLRLENIKTEHRNQSFIPETGDDFTLSLDVTPKVPKYGQRKPVRLLTNVQSITSGETSDDKITSSTAPGAEYKGQSDRSREKFQHADVKMKTATVGCKEDGSGHVDGEISLKEADDISYSKPMTREEDHQSTKESYSPFHVTRQQSVQGRPTSQISPRPMELNAEVVISQSNQSMKRCRERTWWTCEVCGKKFDRPSLLKRHTRTHTGEKPHACDVCGKAFSTSSSLNTHRRIHSGEKPHQCKICGKRFTASSNLYYHRMTHNKQKPHKCDLCSKSFPTPGDLRSHMYIHNGSWPYRCQVCNRGFSKQTNLKNHMLLHSGDKPHDCMKCGKRFALLCNLKTHLKTHEGSDSSDSSCCVKCGAVLEQQCHVQSGRCGQCTQPSKTEGQGHTDFSISKITSTDTTNKKANILTSTFGSTSEKLQSGISSSFVSHSGHLPLMHRQLYSSEHHHQQQHWYVLPYLLPHSTMSQHLKPPSAFNNVKLNSNESSHAQSLSGLSISSHSLLQALPHQDIISSNRIYSQQTMPPGFPVSNSWTGQVIAPTI